MPFPGVVDPVELAILRQTLNEYCAENGIGPDDPERDHAALRIMALFSSGIRTGHELRRRLRDWGPSGPT